MQVPISTVLTNVTPDGEGGFSFTDQNGSTTPPMTLSQCEALANKYQANGDIGMEILIADWFVRGGSENPDSCNGTMLAINFSAEAPMVLNRNE